MENNATKIAVLIPCCNEELTVADVARQFRTQLPAASVYVFDNASTDRTVEAAETAGAVVFHGNRHGKGYVVQSMFQQIESDIYVMVDGDGAHPASDVHKLIEPILNNTADMTIGSRLHKESASRFKFLNRLGNEFFLFFLKMFFKTSITDMLSGYRAFNKNFVKRISLSCGGFEIETELTIKALNQNSRISEIPVDVVPRPQGSFSKINIIRDGLRITKIMLSLFSKYKPIRFYSLLGLFILIVIIFIWSSTL